MSSQAINSQVLEAVEATNRHVVGSARSHSLALTYQGLATSLDLMMLDQVRHRAGMQAIQVAMVSATSARILAVGPSPGATVSTAEDAASGDEPR